MINSLSCSLLVRPKKYTNVLHLAKFWCGLVQINDIHILRGYFTRRFINQTVFLVPKEYSSRLFPAAYWYVPRQTVRTLLHFEQPNGFPSTRGIFIESISCGVLGFVSIKKMLSFQYTKPHCGDKTVLKSSYLYNTKGFPTAKMAHFFLLNQHPGGVWYIINVLLKCQINYVRVVVEKTWEHVCFLSAV